MNLKKEHRSPKNLMWSIQEMTRQKLRVMIMNGAGNHRKEENKVVMLIKREKTRGIPTWITRGILAHIGIIMMEMVISGEYSQMAT